MRSQHIWDDLLMQKALRLRNHTLQIIKGIMLLNVCPSPLVEGKWVVEQLKENKVPGDKGLVLKSRAKHHAISAMLDKSFVFQDEPLVVQ